MRFAGSGYRTNRLALSPQALPHVPLVAVPGLGAILVVLGQHVLQAVSDQVGVCAGEQAYDGHLVRGVVPQVQYVKPPAQPVPAEDR